MVHPSHSSWEHSSFDFRIPFLYLVYNFATFFSNEVEMWMLVCIVFFLRSYSCMETAYPLISSISSFWGLSLLKGNCPKRLSSWPWCRRRMPISILNALPSLIGYYSMILRYFPAFFPFTLNLWNVINFIVMKERSAQECRKHIWEKTCIIDLIYIILIWIYLDYVTPRDKVTKCYWIFLKIASKELIMNLSHTEFWKLNIN